MAPYDRSSTPKPRLRSRTSTLSRTPIREGSPSSPSLALSPFADDLAAPSGLSPSDAAASSSSASASLAAPAPHATLPRAAGRRASKSVSQANRPAQQRGMSVHSSLEAPGLTPGGLKAQVPLLATPGERRNGLKRRISTPNMANQRLLSPEPEDAPLPEQAEAAVPSHAVASGSGSGSGSGAAGAGGSRARSTSTSNVVPPAAEPFQPTIAVAPPLAPVSDHGSIYASPVPAARGVLPMPAADVFGADDAAYARPAPSIAVAGAVHSALARVMDWATLAHTRHRRDDSSSDSEKGLDGSEDEPEAESSDARESRDGTRRAGRYWGIFDSDDAAAGGHGAVGDGYFSLPPSPPAIDEKDGAGAAGIGIGLGVSGYATLPTPALSRSLSKHARRPRADGWWLKVYRKVAGKSDGRTAQVLRELGWTVAMLCAVFAASLLVVVGLIQGMPITQLKHVPKSTTDLQLLSAEIRAYMASGDSGWWHTVSVITFIGCWKHAWSVPGAVVLNILVGSLLDPLPAVGLLTIITACGSLFAYMLSRPLAPLIAVLFPKPLALVRAALAPESDPSSAPHTHDTVTPLQLSGDPAARALGGEAERANVWRRLLVMRAMGFVPWSGMNVACGVVGVDWKTFWLTTAAGSASWSYVTASVGNILARLAVPTTAAAAAAALAADPAAGPAPGESLTSLLRDPALIAKLVFLSALTLVPVLLKRRGPARADPGAVSTPTFHLHAPSPPLTPPLGALGTAPTAGAAAAAGGPLRLAPHLRALADPAEPISPLSASLRQFTPTPSAFDLLSFGRTAIRTSGRAVFGTVRGVAGGAKRVAGSVLG
ncbi:hypothetical protein Q5752_000903 [Cryptotrichosporon argae]